MSNRRPGVQSAVRTLLFLAAFSLTLSAQDAPGTAEGLDESETRGLVAQYQKTDQWTLKAIVLSALGRHWHPAAADIVLDALNSKDARLRAFALETLRRSDPETLGAAARADLVDNLVRKQLRVEHPFYRARVLEVLKLVAPDADASTVADWSRWWSKDRESGWTTKSWTPPKRAEIEGESRSTRATSFVERAFDLNLAGIEAAICIDATGSMQPTIDAAREAVGDMMAVLRGIAPKFRLGIVWYRDFGDCKDGADILLPLSPQLEAVRAKFRNLTASGGGDAPERVEKGLEFALNPAMGWQPTAHKVILVVGDAPPHPPDVSKAVELARKAHEGIAPKDGKAGDVATGGKKEPPKPRGFLISTMGVGKGQVATRTAETFRQIAKAGGGTYGELLANDAKSGDPIESAGRIIAHVLGASFGEAWATSTDDFVKTYLEYRRQRVFE